MFVLLDPYNSNRYKQRVLKFFVSVTVLRPLSQGMSNCQSPFACFLRPKYELKSISNSNILIISSVFYVITYK
jgi:hypothetical protein